MIVKNREIIMGGSKMVKSVSIRNVPNLTELLFSHMKYSFI